MLHHFYFITYYATRVSEKFCNILVYAWLRHIYYMTKAVFNSIEVADAMTHCALLHSMCGLKTTQMNGQQSLI